MYSKIIHLFRNKRVKKKNAVKRILSLTQARWFLAFFRHSQYLTRQLTTFLFCLFLFHSLKSPAWMFTFFMWWFLFLVIGISNGQHVIATNVICRRGAPVLLIASRWQFLLIYWQLLSIATPKPIFRQIRINELAICRDRPIKQSIFWTKWIFVKYAQQMNKNALTTAFVVCTTIQLHLQIIKFPCWS